MKISQNRIRNLVLGILLALVGYGLCACDGGTTGEGEGDQPDGGGKSDGLVRSDAGLVSCSVPSPTGDVPGAYGSQARDTQYFMLVQNETKEACESYKANYKVYDPGYAPQVEMAALIKGIDCSDVANDFRGTTGKSWCVSLTEMDGTTVCSENFTGNGKCKVSGMGIMQPLQNPRMPVGTLNRAYGTCSPTGHFQGWYCN
jgi:hypothetical protein